MTRAPGRSWQQPPFVGCTSTREPGSAHVFLPQCCLGRHLCAEVFLGTLPLVPGPFLLRPPAEHLPSLESWRCSEEQGLCLGSTSLLPSPVTGAHPGLSCPSCGSRQCHLDCGIGILKKPFLLLSFRPLLSLPEPNRPFPWALWLRLASSLLPAASQAGTRSSSQELIPMLSSPLPLSPLLAAHPWPVQVPPCQDHHSPPPRGVRLV